MKASDMGPAAIRLPTTGENIWQFDFHRIDWHWHHELEFLLSSESAVSCLVGTDRIELPKGYGIFINSGLLHRYEAKESAYSPNIVFSPALLAPEGSRDL